MPAWVNVTDDLRFLPSGGQFLWASERSGYMHLYRYGFDGSLVNEITRGDWAVATADDAAFWVRQSVAGVDEREGWVYFVSLQQSPIERQLYRFAWMARVCRACRPVAAATAFRCPRTLATTSTRSPTSAHRRGSRCAVPMVARR